MISVIMSIKNNETLKSSIESVLSQTYKDFEFLIMNDNSNILPQFLKIINKKTQE